MTSKVSLVVAEEDDDRILVDFPVGLELVVTVRIIIEERRERLGDPQRSAASCQF